MKSGRNSENTILTHVAGDFPPDGPTRLRIDDYDARFRELHEVLVSLANEAGDKPCDSILRAAAVVEQTFNGITTRLWDDPFEWTLPEHLSSKERKIEYLNEVDETRKRGFEYFKDDSELERQIPAPQEFTTITELLRRTLEKANAIALRTFS